MEIIKIADDHVYIVFEVSHYTPERPAPACSNPSSPAYADCGDDAELEINRVGVQYKGMKPTYMQLGETAAELLIDHYWNMIIERLEEERCQV